MASIKPKEVVALLDELKQSPATQQRLSGYETIVDELGREIIESERFSYMTQKTTRTKHSWEVTDDKTEFLVHIPFLPQIIEAQRTVIGAMRSHRVPVPTDSAQAYCDKLERGIAHLWREWGMPRLLSEMGWYAVVFGAAVGVLQWSKTDKMPRAVIRSPENFFALPSADDERRVHIGMFSTKTLGRILNKEYPEMKGVFTDTEEYEMIDYYDSEVRMRVVRDIEKPLIEAKNPIKRVPIYVFPGVVIPNSIFGASFVTQCIPVQNEIDRLYSRQAEYLQKVLDAPTYIKDPDNVPENFTWSPDVVVTMGPQGDIGKAPIAALDARVFEYRLEDMKRNLDNAMDFASISRGEMPSQIFTGKGVTALTAPSMQRTMLRLQSIDPEIERMTEDALLMWHKAGRAGNIHGTLKGSMFADVFDPKKDIDPSWVKVYVYLDAASFIDRQAAQITALQKLRGQPQAMSLQRFLELDPDCEDVQAEKNRIMQEMQELMQAQMAIMQPQQNPEEEAYAAERGGAVPGAQPAAMPPMGAGATPEGGAAMAGQPPEPGGEDVIAVVADIFRSIPKIRGEVWLVGDYLAGGITPEEFADGFIEVYVSEPLDKQTILNGLRQTDLAPAVEQQRVVFHEDRGILENHLSLDVSPGSVGYEPTMAGEEPPALGMEEEEMIPEEEMPEEEMMPEGMMGV